MGACADDEAGNLLPASFCFDRGVAQSCAARGMALARPGQFVGARQE